MSALNALPADGLLRQRQILGDRTSNPPLPALVPVAPSTWWAGIAAGIYPQPVRLGPRAIAWRVRDIRELIENGITVTGALSEPAAHRNRGGGDAQ